MPMMFDVPTPAAASGRTDTAMDALVQPSAFDDLRSFADSFEWWDNEITQIDAGVFSGRRTLAALGAVHLLEERSNRALRQRGCIPAGQAVVGFICGEGQTDATRDARVLVCSGGADYEVVFPRHAAFYVSMDEFRMHELLEECWPATHHGNPGRIWLDMQLPTGRAFSQQLRVVMTQSSLNGGALAVDSVRANIADCVFAGLIDAFSSVSRPQVNRRLPLEGLVRRSLEFTHANPNTPITVGDLCMQVGASRRTLQRAFVELVDVTPHEFLLSLRMNGVRRTLQSESAESVTAAATHWGFWHLGRFAAYYRQAFGEQPSETLRQTAPS
jgi:AraC family ethanolamine operon transcriptional activator